MIRKPSVKTLARVFDDPLTARRILLMPRTQLEALPAGAARVRECHHAPQTWDVRMHALNATDRGLFGIEHAQAKTGEFASYLNTGDTYAATLIYWRGRYRVQSLGDFVETMERCGVHFD